LAIFLIGLFPATNFWDFPIYIVVSGAIYFYANLKAHNFKFLGLAVAFVQVAVTGIASYLVVLPFQMAFDPISSKIELVTQGSLFYQLLVLYGYQAFFFAMLLAEAYALYKNPIELKPLNARRGRKGKNQDSSFSQAPQPLAIQASSAQDNGIPLLAFLEKANPGDVIAGILFVCAFGLIIIPEVIYIKDIYPNSPRANTMFKLCYQAFIMLCLGIGYTYPRLFMHHGEKGGRYLAMVSIATVFLFCAFVYPFYAIPGSYGSLSLGNYKGLNGIKFMETYKSKVLDRNDPDEPEIEAFVDDVPIVEYLNKVKGQPVIVEANHLSYTPFGRIASFTGLPDIFNWYTHQELWRSSKFDEFNERVDDIRNIYCGEDPAVTTSLLQKYNVRYIVVGQLERTKFGDAIQQELIKSLGSIVVQSNETYLLELF
jgi:YYY domain-containing protein